jgi:hypothetical protein
MTIDEPGRSPYRTLRVAVRDIRGTPGLTVLMAQDFGARPGDLNPCVEFLTNYPERLGK